MNSRAKHHDPLAEIRQRARTEPEFSRRLHSDPHAVIEQYMGQTDSEVEIRVVQDTPDTLYLHLPSPPPEGEITDQDLTYAQGGTTTLCSALIVTVISAISVSAHQTTEP
ncbi:hypothetical protein [Ruegeria jejuensis]|uniref:hypothetical protein n=1 Tax=Ruegeria jejuensis TaxID=3233338 RepID=UPI00355BE1FA